jgi:glycosyltransferase involved in cell wall biosynthesis
MNNKKISNCKTICVDARVLEWKRGALANFLIAVLPEIASGSEYNLVLLFQNYIPEDAWLKDKKITCILVRGPKFLRRNKTLTEQIIFPFYLIKIQPDLYFGTAYTVPIFPLRVKKVTALWDISYSTHPEHYGKIRGWVLHTTSRLSSIVSKSVITCSEFDAKQINSFYRKNMDAIKVLDLGIHARFFQNIEQSDIEKVKKKYNINSDYFLSLGVIYNRRNVDKIIQGFDKIKEKHHDIQLVIIGRMERNLDIRVKDLIRTLGNSGSIIYFDWIENDEIAQIYAGALYYICTSMVDGESIMLREAMATGTPVITSTLLMPAVNQLALEIKNPNNANEWEALLTRAITDKKKMMELSKQGKKWAKGKQWSKVCKDFTSFLNDQF